MTKYHKTVCTGEPEDKHMDFSKHVKDKNNWINPYPANVENMVSS